MVNGRQFSHVERWQRFGRDQQFCFMSPPQETALTAITIISMFTTRRTTRGRRWLRHQTRILHPPALG